MAPVALRAWHHRHGPRCLAGIPGMARFLHRGTGDGRAARSPSQRDVPVRAHVRIRPTRFLSRLLSILVSRSMSALPTQEIKKRQSAEATRSIAFFFPATVLMSYLFYTELTSWTALDTLLCGPR